MDRSRSLFIAAIPVFLFLVTIPLFFEIFRNAAFGGPTRDVHLPAVPPVAGPLDR
jgi:hypothetical protein